MHVCIVMNGKMNDVYYPVDVCIINCYLTIHPQDCESVSMGTLFSPHFDHTLKVYMYSSTEGLIVESHYHITVHHKYEH